MSIKTWIWKKCGYSYQRVLERWWSASFWSGLSLDIEHRVWLLSTSCRHSVDRSCAAYMNQCWFLPAGGNTVRSNPVVWWGLMVSCSIKGRSYGSSWVWLLLTHNSPCQCRCNSGTQISWCPARHRFRYISGRCPRCLHSGLCWHP